MTVDNVVLKAFTKLAPDFEETMDRELREFLGVGYEEFVDKLVEIAGVEQGDLVLDVATATGLIPVKLVERLWTGCQVVRLDITPRMLRHASNNVAAAKASGCIRLVCASGLAMPFVEGTFDVVTCGFGTHHMDVPQMLTEMRRALKEGGTIILVEACAPAFWRSFLVRVLLQLLVSGFDLTHRSARARAEVEAFGNIRTQGEWQAALQEAGFTSVDLVQSSARRRWYPHALTIKAVSGNVAIS